MERAPVGSSLRGEKKEATSLIELTRTNDPVLISWLSAHLQGAGIEHVVLDAHTSVMEGSIGAIQRRVMILAEDEKAARAVLDARPGLEDDDQDEALSGDTVPAISG